MCRLHLNHLPGAPAGLNKLGQLVSLNVDADVVDFVAAYTISQVTNAHLFSPLGKFSSHLPRR